jgi:hypothetical protein
MRRWTTTVILIGIIIPGLALGEIYYWVDDQGTQYYTTRLENIPEPYRDKAQQLSLPTSPPVPPERTTIPPQRKLVKIPFNPGSPVFVSAKINGVGPITLILDTGADRTLIRLSALGRLGISMENATGVLLSGVTGKTYGDAVWVDSVEVGESRVGPLFIIVHDADLKGADGLLGRDFLANFNVTIDSKERVVTLVPN